MRFRKLLDSYFVFALMLIVASANAQVPTAQITSNPGAVDDVITICNTDAVTFGDVSSGGPTSRSWTFENGTPATSSLSNQSVTYNIPGLHMTVLEVSNSFGSDFDTVFVEVLELPGVTINPSPSPVLCNGGTVTLNTNIHRGPPPYTYSWSPGTGLSSTSSPNPTVSGLSVNETYILTLTDGNGCDTSVSVDIFINPPINVFAGNDTTLCSDDSTQLKASVSGGAGGTYTFLWTPASGLSNDTILRPMVAPTSITTYTLTVTDSNGCSSSDQVKITASPELVASAGPDTLLCGDDEINIGGNPSAMGGYPGYSYLWNPPGGLNNVTFPNPAVSGISGDMTYTLRVTDSKGCVDRDTVVVRYGNSVFVDAGGNEKICAGDSVQLSGFTDASGGRYEIEWVPSTGLSDSSILNPYANPISTTLYTLTVRDTLVGCVSSDQMRVFVNPPLFVDAGEDTILCEIPETSFFIGGEPTAFGGTPGYTYEWTPSDFLSADNAENPEVIGLNTDTEYHLKVTDSEGCVEFDTILITINPPLNAFAGNDFNICYDATRTIYGSASGGTPPYRYRWFPSGMGIFSDEQVSDPSITLTDTIDLYLMVVDSANCTVFDTVRAYVFPELIADAGLDSGICFGDSIQLGGNPTASGGSGSYSYSWSPGQNLNDSTLANPWAIGLTNETEFTLLVTDDSNCVTMATVTITPSPEIFADAGPDTTFCYESPIRIGGNPTGQGGSAPLTYLWSNSSGATLSPNNTTANPFITNQSIDTWYYLQVTDQFGCSDYDTLFVKFNPEIFIDAGNDTLICYETTFNLRGSASGGSGNFTYNWFPADNLDDNTIANPTVTGLNSTTNFILTVTDQEGCSKMNGVTVEVAPELTADAGSDGIACYQGSYQLGGNPSANGGLGTYTYSWTPSLGLDDSTSSNPTLNGLTSYTCFALTVTDSLGCTAIDTICIDTNPEIIADPGSVTEVCYNTPTQLNGSASGGTGGYTYRWNPGTGLSDRNRRNPTVTLTTDQSYQFIVTDGVGCKDTATLDITVLPQVLANAGADDTLCFGDTLNLNGIALNGTPGYSYNWSPAGGLSDPNIANPEVTGLTSNTNYTLTVTDSKGCLGTDVVRIYARPELIAEAGQDVVLCFGESLTIGGSPTASGGAMGYRYSWSPASGLNDSTIANPTVSGITATTTYTITLTDLFGCQDLDSVTVVYNPEIIIDLATDTLICYGDSIQIDPIVTGGTPPYNASWSPSSGLSNPNILNPKASPTVSTTYTLNIVDSNLCTSSTTFRINVNPEITVEAGDDVVQCFNDSVQIGGFPSVTGGTGPFTFSWNPTNNLSDPNLANPYVKGLILSQYYYLTATDQNGDCAVTDSVFVTANPAIIVDAGLDVSVCANTPYQMQSSVTGGSGGFTYLWTPATGLDDNTLLQPTSTLSADQVYTLVATDQNGCKDSSQVTITVYDEMTVDAGATRTVCDGDDTQLGGAPTAMNGTMPYTFRWTPTTLLNDSTSSNPVVSGLNSATWFHVTVEDVNGCSQTDSVFVDFSLLPIADFSISSTCGSDSACRNVNTQLTDISSTPLPGGAITQWQWDINNDGTIEYITQNPNHVFTVLGAIPIKLKITSEHGCVDSIIRSIYISEAPTAGFTIDQDTGCTVLDATFTNTSTGTTDTYLWTVYADSNGTQKIIYTSNNANPNPVPQFQQSENGDTLYFIRLDIGNCCGSSSFTDTVVVKPSPFPDFQWDYVSASCSPAQVDFQPDQFTSGAPDSIVFNWGDGTPSNTYTPNTNPPYWNIIRHTYTYSGVSNDTTYTVTLTAYNECGQASITRDILVRSNSINAFMRVDGPTQGCSPFTTSFINASSRTTNASWCFDYDSIANSCNAPFVSPNDTVFWTFTSPGNYLIALFVDNNCSYDTVYRSIEVFDSPVADFTMGASRCVGDQVAFSNNSSIGGGNTIVNHQWNFGDTASGANNQSNAVNPIHQFNAPGTYSVCLDVTSNSSPACRDTLCRDITIYELPIADFTVQQSSCFNEQPLTGSNNSYEPSSNSNVIYQWEMGDPGNSSFVGNNFPNFSYPSPGIYNIRLTVIAEFEGGLYQCSDDTSITVTIDPSPIADFDYYFTSGDSCGAPASIQTVNNSSPDTLVNYNWYLDYDDNPGQTPKTEKEPSYTFNNPGQYELMLTIMNQYGCVDTIRKVINIYHLPVADFTVSPTTCIGDSIFFTDLSTYTPIGSNDAINSWFWDFGDGSTSTLQNPGHIYNNSGTYSVSLSITTTGNCTDMVTYTDLIQADPSPIADYTYQQTGAILEWQFYQNVSDGTPPYTYYWDFGDSTSSTDPNPTHRFRLDLYYHDETVPVCLTVTDVNGCQDSICLDFTIEGFSLYVPNALAPRGTGGEETYFLPKGRNLISYHLKIFDAWGSLIWETTSLDADGQPNEPWYGEVNGVPMPQGAYVWQIDAIFIDGTGWRGKTYESGKTINIGTVNLLR